LIDCQINLSSYFILKTNTGSGAATAKEKEMICSLFCKLALLMRKKLSCFGSDTNITVRCLRVLIKAVDASSVMKNSQDIVRASLLPYFSYAAEDLKNIIEDIKNNRLSNVKGTSQKTLSNLDYINMVLLPVLASMFDHLGANKYGADVFGLYF
jgi:ryanodine receptor 2